MPPEPTRPSDEMPECPYCKTNEMVILIDAPDFYQCGLCKSAMVDEKGLISLFKANHDILSEHGEDTVDSPESSNSRPVVYSRPVLGSVLPDEGPAAPTFYAE